MLPTNSQLVKRVLHQAKSSADLLASNEEELFEVFSKAADTATHTCTSEQIVEHCLPDSSIILSLDLEACKAYLKPGNPYIPKAIRLE